MFATVNDLREAIKGIPFNATLFFYTDQNGTRLVAEGDGGFRKVLINAPSVVPGAGGPAVVTD